MTVGSLSVVIGIYIRFIPKRGSFARTPITKGKIKINFSEIILPLQKNSDMSYYHSKYATNVRRKSSKKKYILLFLLFLLILGGGAVYYLNNIINSPNTWVKGSSTLLKIPHETNYQGLLDSLYSKGIVIHRKNFEWWAKLKKLDKHVKAGNYRIDSGMTNKALVNTLINGLQEPIKLVINNIRTKQDLAGSLGSQLEPDSIDFLLALNNPQMAEKYGLNQDNILTLIIPNTYEFYWTTNVEGFFEKINKEYKKFWNNERLQLAKEKNLSPTEVSILASIVQKESNKNDEKPTVASVYLNRLKRNWKLQADPTVVFALQDFGIRRVLTKHLEVDSPYNTYKYEGLPPGPICLPSSTSIDAVLHATETDYLFFCAKDDFSGYHAFAKTAAGHGQNARKYRRALNKRKILK